MGRVLVAGGVNMDVVATAERHPQVGETVAGSAVLYFPGGKGANQAVAAAKLGATTALIGRVGKDSFGEDVKSFLAGQGIDLSLLAETAGVHTGTAIITLANADNTIVVIPGANGMVSEKDVALVPLAKGDIAASQFEIPPAAMIAFFRRARAAGATTILNPAPARPCTPDLLDLVDILVLNETELALLAKTQLCRSDDPSRIIDMAAALQAGRAQIVCVTLGSRGVAALADNGHVLIAGRKVKAIDTTGAGDCFVGALAAQLARGAFIREAIAYANTAASICVQRMGAAPSMPTAAEVDAVLSGA